MKATLFDSQGNKKETLELPAIFETPIREDILTKYLEVSKSNSIHPYSPDKSAGKKHSASGTISHRRHTWGGHYGRGISRAPRKTMSRRGTQFFWIGASVSGARGGRRAHPPKFPKKAKKINKKEIKIAMHSALAATANKDYLKQRYGTLANPQDLPAVIESLPTKTKDLKNTLKNILLDNFRLAFKKKTIRAGKGKLRGRKYKSNTGLLLITSQKEKTSFKGIELKTPTSIKISDLYPLGRLTLYTKKALEELSK